MLAFEKDHELIKDFMHCWHTFITRRQDSYLSLFHEKEVIVLAGYGRKRLLAKGQNLFSQGDPARSLAVVLKGRLDVYKMPEDTGSEDGTVKKGKYVASIEVGETVGEMTLITDGKGDSGTVRTATVRASNVLTTVIVFDYNDFAAFIFDHLPEARAIKVRTAMRDMVIARLYPKEKKPWEANTANSPPIRTLRKSVSQNLFEDVDSGAQPQVRPPPLHPPAQQAPQQMPGGEAAGDGGEESKPASVSAEPKKAKAEPKKMKDLASIFAQSHKEVSEGSGFLDGDGSEDTGRMSTSKTEKRRRARERKVDPDNPWNCPTTIVNIDSLLECLWQAKFSDKEMTDQAKEVNEDVIHVPHTAIFHDGELVQWYFGSGGSMKKRHRERMVAWALIEEFCGKNSNSNHQHTKTVAMMVTWKPGKDRDSEFVQCRQLTKHKLESVVNGAKANNFTGILQKYVSASSHGRAPHDDEEEEQVLQCAWTPHSCSIETIPETMLECFTETHKGARILPNKKTLRARMQVVFHHYVPGTLSTFGDYLTSTQLMSRPILTEHVATAPQRFLEKVANLRESGTASLQRKKARNKAFEPRRSQSADMWKSKAVPLQMRENCKMACARIAVSLQTRINSSKNAQRKAELMKSLDGSEHDIYFSQVMSMSCLFKVKGGVVNVLHCDVAMSHPDTKPSMSLLALNDIKKPNEEKFLFYSQFGLTENRLSAQGARATTMDFTEFSRYLAAAEILYKHVSLTQASWVFAQAIRVEDGTGNGLSAAAKAKQASGMSDNADREMTFPMFKKAMRTIADLLDIEVDGNDFFGKHPSGGGNDDGGNSNVGMASSVASLSGAKPAASPKKLAKLEGTSKSMAGSLARAEEEGSRATPSKSGKTKKGEKGDATSPSGHDKRPWGGGPGPGIDTSLWGYVPKDKDVKRPWQEQREQALIEARTHGEMHKMEPVSNDDVITTSIDDLRKYEAVERTRLGRMFANDLLQRQEEILLEERQKETEEKHTQLIARRQAALAEQLEKEQAAAKLRLEAVRKKFQEQSEAEQERARQKWIKVQENSRKLEESRKEQMRLRKIEAEQRMERRGRQLAESERYHEEKKRDYHKKTQLIDEMHLRMNSKKERMQETRRRFWGKIAREKEVVGELFETFIHTGKLHRPWAAVDLDGDAIPTVFEVATVESTPVSIAPGQSTLHLPKGRLRASMERSPGAKTNQV